MIVSRKMCSSIPPVPGGRLIMAIRGYSAHEDGPYARDNAKVQISRFSASPVEKGRSFMEMGA